MFYKKFFIILISIVGAIVSSLADEPQLAIPKYQPKAKIVLDNKEQKSPADKKLDAVIVATTQSAEFDIWQKMPKGATPHISSTNKIYFNEKFALLPIVYNASVKDGRFKLSYSITASAPDGESMVIVENANFEGEKKSISDILNCPDVIDIKFDKQYQNGKYAFTITVVDAISGQKVSNTTYVDVCKWIQPESLKDAKLLEQAFFTFYTKPSPELLYSMFFSKDMKFEQPDAPYGLNYMILGFFRAGFNTYKFLVNEILQNFDTYTNHEKARIMLLMRVLEKPLIKEERLNKNQIAYQKKLAQAEIPNPYEDWHPVLAAIQLDLLVGEFYATGTYKPVRRIMNLLANEQQFKKSEEMIAKKSRPKTKSEWNEFTMGILHKIAITALIRNSNASDLFDQYCVWAVENNDLPKDSIVVAKRIFGLEKQELSNFKKATNDIKLNKEPLILKK